MKKTDCGAAVIISVSSSLASVSALGFVGAKTYRNRKHWKYFVASYIVMMLIEYTILETTYCSRA